MSIRHADPDELDHPAVAETETRQALRAWWDRWEKLPIVKRDRPVVEVLAEERNRDQRMPARYVLDASAGVDILQRTPEGQALSTVLRAQGDDEPELWTVEHFHVEVAKVIRRDTLAGVLDDQEATGIVETLAEWPLTVVSVAPLLVEAWQLRNNLTIHDALYVVATRRLEDATLVSTDTKLRGAPGVDVPIITPDQLPR